MGLSVAGQLTRVSVAAERVTTDTLLWGAKHGCANEWVCVCSEVRGWMGPWGMKRCVG